MLPAPPSAKKHAPRGEKIYFWKASIPEKKFDIEEGRLYQEGDRLYVGTGDNGIEIHRLGFMGENLNAEEFNKEYRVNGKLLGKKT